MSKTDCHSLTEAQYQVRVILQTLKKEGLEGLSTEQKQHVKDSLVDIRETQIKNKVDIKDYKNEEYPSKDVKGYKTFVQLKEVMVDNEPTFELTEVAKVKNGHVGLDQLPKLKINEEYRNLFPEQAQDLEKNGQDTPILMDANGFVHDGEKRKLLCGLDQLEIKLVPIDSECSNLNSLTNVQKKALSKDLYYQLKFPWNNEIFNDEIPNQFRVKHNLSVPNNETRDNSIIVKTISKRYGIPTRTVYRWIEEWENERLGNVADSVTLPNGTKRRKVMIPTSMYPVGAKVTLSDFLGAVDGKCLREERFYVVEVDSQKYKEYQAKQKKKFVSSNLRSF
jgi:hypothetical protein